MLDWTLRFYRSTVGAKVVVAVTGLLLVGFLLAHLSGNLLVFAGKEAFNAYAYQLKGLGPLLWVARIGLLFFFVLHIVTTIRLAKMTKQARKQYHVKRFKKASWFSRTMVVSGLIVLAFVLYHLAHFTFWFTHPEFGTWTDASGRHDAYRMVVAGFGSPVVSFFYITGLVLLGFHLNHGLQSFTQTLGVNGPKVKMLITVLGPALGWLVILSFISIPVSVLLGIVQ